MTVQPKTERVKEMFDHIAPTYDRLNHILSLSIDKIWRRRVVRRVLKLGAKEILDVATGTGDLAIKLARSLCPNKITGIDLSEGMIAIGRKKVADAHLDNIITFVAGDCLNLPFDEAQFDCITVAYGVRNFEHLDQGYREMYRVLKPGGVLCVIELSTPTSPIVKPFYKLYTRCIIPFVGRLVSKDVRAYSYLPESIAAVPQGNDMLQLMREAGFNSCHYKRLTFGTCTIYMAIK